MTKKELIAAVAAETGAEKKVVEAIVSETFAAITAALKEGEKVQIFGFGNFETKEVAAREGRNPATGETIQIPASKKTAFTAAKALKDAVNA